MSLPELQAGISYLRQTAETAGRDPDSLEVVLRTGLMLTDGRRAASEVGSLQTPWEQSTAFSGEESRLPFRGPVSQVIDDIHQAERIGVCELIFESPVQRSDERFDTIEAFAAEVLPSFRQAPAGRAVLAGVVSKRSARSTFLRTVDFVTCPADRPFLMRQTPQCA